MTHRGARQDQRGASMILVIAVLVLLGGLVAYSVGLVTSVNRGYARELSHARAHQAAEAGLEWARYRVTALAVPQCAASPSINTLPGSLRPYTVTVLCTVTGPFNESGAPVRAYQLDATACSQPLAGQCPNPAPAADYVARTVTTVIVR